MARASSICPKCWRLKPCPVHGAQAKSFGSADRNYLPRNWGAIRRMVLERDPICVLCGAAQAEQVDHIGSKYDHRLENLRGVCKPCHTERTIAQAHAAKRRKKLLREAGLSSIAVEGLR
jgi:5-methylcytosine-specific restriction enzyme A